MRHAAASVQALRVNAPIDKRNMHFVSAACELRRKRRELPFRPTAGKRQDHVQDSHACTAFPRAAA